MKILVDKMPRSSEECPFAQWEPNPPIIERPGDYYCLKNKKLCNLYKKLTECYFFKEYKNE